MDLSDFHTRVASYAVIIDDAGRILLSWWRGTSDRPDLAAWTLPGGGVEYGEDLEEAAVREVYEETGYHVALTGYLASDTFAPQPEPGQRPYLGVRVVYTVTIIGGTLGTVEIDGSTERAAWIPIGEVDVSGPCVRLVDVALRALEARRGRG